VDRALAKILSARKKMAPQKASNDIQAALDRIARKRISPLAKKESTEPQSTALVDQDDVMAALQKIRAKRSQVSNIPTSAAPTVVTPVTTPIKKTGDPVTGTANTTITATTNTTPIKETNNSNATANANIPVITTTVNPNNMNNIVNPKNMNNIVNPNNNNIANPNNMNSAVHSNSMASVFAIANATTNEIVAPITTDKNSRAMKSNNIGNNGFVNACPPPNATKLQERANVSAIKVPTIDLTSAAAANKNPTKVPRHPKTPFGFIGKQFKIPAWASKEQDRAYGLALEVEKDGRIIDSIPMGSKNYYTLGRSTIPGSVDICMLHRSLSRLHAAIVHGTPKCEKGATLFDLSSANGTFLAIGGQWVRLVPRQPYVLQEGDRIAFGNSTRAYIVSGLRCPTPPPEGVGPMEQARQAQEKMVEAAREEEKNGNRKQTIAKKRAAKKKNWQNTLQSTFSGFSEKDKFLKLLMGKKQKA